MILGKKKKKNALCNSEVKMRIDKICRIAQPCMFCEARVLRAIRYLNERIEGVYAHYITSHALFFIQNMIAR